MEALTRMAQRDHGDVIASVAAGDEIAFQQIIAEHHDDMRRVCSYVTRDEAVAEEATYAAWAIVWRKIGSVREPASLAHLSCRQRGQAHPSQAQAAGRGRGSY
jgi:hypothetical protein